MGANSNRNDWSFFYFISVLVYYNFSIFIISEVYCEMYDEMYGEKFKKPTII